MKQNFQNDTIDKMVDLEEMTANDETMMLMSMALDGLLSSEEERHLNQLVENDTNLALIWEDWQRMDSRFSNIGRVLPPVDFVHQFELRLDAQTSKQLWWSNLFVLIGALVIWGGLLTGAIFVGYQAFANQAELMSGFVHFFTGMAASWMQWLRALQIAVTTASSSPQTVSLAFGYVCAAAAALMWWIHFLRTSTQALDSSQTLG